MSLEKWGNAATQSAQVLKTMLLLGLLPSCLLFFWYCVTIDFFPTVLSLSELLTGLFLLSVFAVIYIFMWGVLYYLGAPIPLLAMAAYGRLLRKKRGAGSPASVGLRKKTGPWLFSTVNRSLGSRDDQWLLHALALVASCAMAYLAIAGMWPPYFTLKVLGTALAIFLASRMLQWMRTLMRQFHWRFPVSGAAAYQRDLLFIFLVAVFIPAFILRDGVTFMLNSTMEIARVRVPEASVHVPDYVLRMTPKQLQVVGDIHPSDDRMIVVSGAMVYMHRIGSDAMIGIPMRSASAKDGAATHWARVVLPQNDLRVMSTAHMKQ